MRKSEISDHSGYVKVAGRYARRRNAPPKAGRIRPKRAKLSHPLPVSAAPPWRSSARAGAQEVQARVASRHVPAGSRPELGISTDGAIGLGHQCVLGAAQAWRRASRHRVLPALAEAPVITGGIGSSGWGPSPRSSRTAASHTVSPFTAAPTPVCCNRRRRFPLCGDWKRCRRSAAQKPSTSTPIAALIVLRRDVLAQMPLEMRVFRHQQGRRSVAVRRGVGDVVLRRHVGRPLRVQWRTAPDRSSGTSPRDRRERRRRSAPRCVPAPASRSWDRRRRPYRRITVEQPAQ